MNTTTVKSVFALLGFAALIAYAGHVHAAPRHHRALPTPTHHVTAGMPATTPFWTVATNSYRSVL